MRSFTVISLSSRVFLTSLRVKLAIALSNRRCHPNGAISRELFAFSWNMANSNSLSCSRCDFLTWNTCLLALRLYTLPNSTSFLLVWSMQRLVTPRDRSAPNILSTTSALSGSPMQAEPRLSSTTKCISHSCTMFLTSAMSASNP